MIFTLTSRCNFITLSWHYYETSDGEYCIALLQPLLGPVDEDVVTVWTSLGYMPRQTLKDLMSSPVLYQLKSAEGVAVCLESDGNPWWRKENSFSQAQMWSYTELLLFSATLTSISSTLGSANTGFFGQDKQDYIEEHQKVWRELRRFLQSKKIKPSQRLSGLFEVGDVKNPFLTHLFYSADLSEAYELDEKAL